MMNKWTYTLLTTALVSTVIISGCGQQTGNAANSNSGHTPPLPTEQVRDPIEQPAPEVDEHEEEEPVAENEPTVEDSSDEPIVIEKTYHMSKNFFIKPNDENGNNKVVLLTFDDGPKEQELLTSILDTLDKHNAKAIFFVNGFRVKQNPDLLKLIDERGQLVGNHSYDHIVLKKESNEKIDQQVEDTQTIVQDTIGKAPQFFRPPNGAGNDYLKDKVKALGMLYMTWSNGSLDWADNRNKPQGVIDSVMDQLLPGSNILMHELTWTAEALDELLTRIAQEGYSFVDPRAIELEARQ